MSILALSAAISFLFIRKPYVHQSLEKEYIKLANESKYFTESSVAGSMYNRLSSKFDK